MFYQFIYEQLSPFVAFIWFASGHLADVLSTVIGIRYAGLREMNPVARPFAHSKHPFLWLVVFKIGILCTLHFMFKGLYGTGYTRRDFRWMGLLGWVAAVWNTAQMIKD